MRSSLHSMKSANLGTYSQIGGIGTMSLIKNNNSVAKDSKFNQADEIGYFFDKLFGNSIITEKDLIDARKVGYSYKKYENGDVYYGQLENDRPHGQGIYIYWESCLDKKPFYYKGSFQNGQFNGFGKLCKILNEREAMYNYQGYWKNNKKQGEGKENYNLQNTMFYKGNFSNDQRNGRGALYFPDGSYDGNWLNGRMAGQGAMLMQRGPFKKIITGQWIDDDIGQGFIQYYSKPSNQLLGEYKGGIKNLVRNGAGQYKSGGCLIEGEFVDDELVGTSTLKNLTSSEECIISGNLTSARLQKLDSEIKYSNNDRFLGKVEITPNNIVRRTEGRYYFGNGEVVEGRFDDNDKGELRKV